MRYYLINYEGQIYNTADKVETVEVLLQKEFGDQYYMDAENDAFIDVTNKDIVTYEGRSYKYLNNHMEISKLIKQVSIIFYKVEKVSKLANYDEFKANLTKMVEIEKFYPSNAVILCLLGHDEE